MRFLLAGGGTAGHIQPAISTALELRSRFPDSEILFLGTSSGLEARLVPEAGFELLLIPRTPFPRRIGGALARFPLSLLTTIRQTRAHLAGVDCLIGFGGYVAAPGYLAAKASGVPFVVHEQNAKPGFANRLGARLTPFVGVSFANTRLPHARLVGLPLNPKVVSAATTTNRAAALSHFGLAPDRPLLLVTGGSQGSQHINMVIADALSDLLSDGWQILHAVGEKNPLPTAAEHYRPVSYINEMEQALMAADLMITRSGAVTCAEATALTVPCIYVPLPIGNGEQALNAMDAVTAGGAVIIPDSQLTSASAVAAIREAQPRLASMRQALKTISSLSGATLLVDLVEKAL